ncbi:hypothetical protein DVH24_035744 [Malus domestica]|uniref:Uncharacterized protein n=1 Tax=Malus domestica TaxID=3750 RepID=A0A498JPV2_MALDO|nr:hypothetical protein DVH24_035744 [Malus domestica]
MFLVNLVYYLNHTSWIDEVEESIRCTVYEHIRKMIAEKMKMLLWMLIGHTRKDRGRIEDIRGKVGAIEIEDKRRESVEVVWTCETKIYEDLERDSKNRLGIRGSNGRLGT